MNRHYLISFIISALVPGLGWLLAWALGMKWEEISHGGTIPDDKDTTQDLLDNASGRMHGLIAGMVFWTMIIIGAMK